MHALIIASGMVSTGFARLVKVFFFVSETLETVSVKILMSLCLKLLEVLPA